MIVWPSVSRTGTLDATLKVTPEATVKPPEKTYCRLDVLVPIRFRRERLTGGQCCRVDVDLLEFGVAGEVLHVAIGDVDGHVEGVAGQVAAGVGAGVVDGRDS